MPGPNDNALSITLPSALVPARGTDTLTLKIATDKSGKRVLSRSLQDANSSAPGRVRTATWEIWSAIGRSLESTSGGLAVDFLQNLESRWERQLRSSIKQNAVDLTGFDPPGIDGAYFGEAYFGDSYFGSGLGSGSSGDGPDVTVFAEQQGYLLVGRGQLLTQVDLTTWMVISTRTLDAVILDMDTWLGNTYIALGGTVPMQRVVAAGAGGMVVEDVVATSPPGNVYASAVKTGSDRAWYIDADENSATFHYASFTLDAFITLAAPFPVGDAMVGVNGIGPYGSLTAFGLQNTISTSTDQGKATKLSRALETVQSSLNGGEFADPGFGWNYYLSSTALRAHTFSGVDNPTGVGERMRGFTGHNGLAFTVYSARGELWVVYQTLAGDLYGYRGQFGPETGGTGQPLLFPWFFAADETCLALFSSTTPNVGTQYMSMIRASGTNLKYMTIARNGMDNLYDIDYSTEGGAAYLTTLDRNPNLLKTLRLARLRARDMPVGSSWAVAVSVDPLPNDPVGSTYTTLGTATVDGNQTITPVSGGAPVANISGYQLKPRLTQAIATAPVTNLVTNPSFETNTTGWAGAAGAAIAQSTDVARFGTHSLKATLTATGTVAYAITLTAAAHMQSVYLFIPSSLVGLTALSVAFAGFTAGTGTASAAADLTLRDQWQRVEVGPFTPDAGDLTGTLLITATLAGVGGALYLDGAMAQLGSAASAYVDGSLGLGYAWNGAADASTSTFSPAVAASASTPSLDGTLELEWDERPEQIEIIDTSCELTGNGQTQTRTWDLLRQLAGSTTEGPYKIQLPDDYTPGVAFASGGGQKYAMLEIVASRNDLSAQVQTVDLRLSCWPAADVLSNT